MTTPLTSASYQQHPFASGSVDLATRLPENGPYSEPTGAPAANAVDAALVDAVRAAVGPYVPSEWRSRAADEAGGARALDPEGAGEAATDLPWIEVYQHDATAPSEPVSESAVGDAAPWTIPEELFALDDPISTRLEETVSQNSDESGEQSTESVDAWPLDETGAAMRDFAEDVNLRAPESAPTTAASELPSPPRATTPPLPMWGDDDVMDIMPVQPSSTPGDRGEEWAARARREAELTGNTEATALALEALARRVRSGELTMPSFAPDMGDAAALSAALAALLSVRR